MNEASIFELFKSRFGDSVSGPHTAGGDAWIEVAPAALLDLCRYLRDEPALRFNFLSCVSGVDYLETDSKKLAKSPFQPHLEVVYHLWSVPFKHRLTLKVMLPRWKDERPGELPELASVAGVWRTADWHEREVYDLCGVRFVGHPDLQRILCPEDWVGYPLRKDYEMPLEYHGIRGR